MIKLVKIGNEYSSPQHMEYIIDSADDVASLPGITQCSAGSIAQCADGITYVMTPSGDWAVQNVASGSGGVKSVNNKTPDENGNITIATGTPEEYSNLIDDVENIKEDFASHETRIEALEDSPSGIKEINTDGTMTADELWGLEDGLYNIVNEINFTYPDGGNTKLSGFAFIKNSENVGFVYYPNKETHIRMNEYRYYLDILNSTNVMEHFHKNVYVPLAQYGIDFYAGNPGQVLVRVDKEDSYGVHYAEWQDIDTEMKADIKELKNTVELQDDRITALETELTGISALESDISGVIG